MQDAGYNRYRIQDTRSKMQDKRRSNRRCEVQGIQYMG